ncbi:MAG: SGNH/GDSL hydrolase family protein, partial [Oscillospiraceae bacterium]|nr:SGNH/GDSL hydrolase family protein [Oscillospiraceae bacterium]
MKKIFAMTIAAMLLLTTAGCGNSETSGNESTSAVDSSEDNTSSAPDADVTSGAEAMTNATEATTAPDEEEVIDYSTLTEEEIYDLMVERSLITTGDETRMANVLDRAAKGEEITVAYIGGSITEGYHDNLTLAEDEKWAKMTNNWLSEQYPDATFNYVNAGLSGTPSILGNIRLERDVLANDPDIVFVEFAVNDGDATNYHNAYESMVRTLLTQDKDIAVVLLFTIVENGHTCQEYMTKIGENYNLPMISLPNSLWVEMQEGRMTWDDYSGDQSHPHVEGSKYIRDYIIYYFEQVIDGAATGEVDKTLPEPIYSDDYMNMSFLESTNLDVEIEGFTEYDTHHWFNDGWFYKGSDGAKMSFEVNCKKLAMVFKANNSQVYGDAQIYIDGELSTTVSSNMESGWNNPEQTYIINNDESAAHTVE